MKTYLLTLFILFSTVLSAQQTPEEVASEGVKLHDAGDYAGAIKKYEEALRLRPDWATAYYEIALSYNAAGEPKKALKYADKVLKAGDEQLLGAYMIKGSILDDMGKTKKSIKVFEEGLERVGEHYLLRYNLGLDHYRGGDFDKAEENIALAIDHNFSHASSHLVLANIHGQKGHRAQTAMAAFFFLLLEPDSPRSSEAQKLAVDAIAGGVGKTKDGNIQINIDAAGLGGGFSALDMMIAMKQASLTGEEKNANLSNLEKFVANTQFFFGMLADKEPTGDIWHDFYAPFFAAVEVNGHTEALVYTSIKSGNKGAATWVEGHATQVEAFQEWVSGE